MSIEHEEPCTLSPKEIGLISIWTEILVQEPSLGVARAQELKEKLSNHIGAEYAIDQLAEGVHGIKGHEDIAILLHSLNLQTSDNGNEQMIGVLAERAYILNNMRK